MVLLHSGSGGVQCYARGEGFRPRTPNSNIFVAGGWGLGAAGIMGEGTILDRFLFLCDYLL
jgi:hypothetical protein